MINIENNGVLWLVGASGGIGSELARAAAGRGMRLVLSGGPPAQLQSLVKLHGGPQRACVVELDLTDVDALTVAVAAARAAFGRIDLLILNAGISQRARAVETDYPVLQRLIQVDFLSQAEIARRVAALMVEQSTGAILVVSSLAGLVASPLRTGYCAAKHAIFGYYNSLRAELIGHNVTVTIGVPGFVRTDISRNAVTAAGATYGKMDPNQTRGSDPADVARGMLDAALRGRREIRLAMGVKGRLAIFLARNLPALYARIIARARVT
jgi:short-subunit dehydrogenase